MKKWIIYQASNYKIRAVLSGEADVLNIYTALTAVYGRCLILGIQY